MGEVVYGWWCYECYEFIHSTNVIVKRQASSDGYIEDNLTCTDCNGKVGWMGRTTAAPFEKVKRLSE